MLVVDKYIADELPKPSLSIFAVPVKFELSPILRIAL